MARTIAEIVAAAVARFGGTGPEHPVWKGRCAGLLLIGTGVPERHALTLEAVKALRACRAVFIADRAAFKRLGRDTDDLWGGKESGRAAVDEVLAELKQGGPVGVLTYGHPLMYGVGGEIVSRCRREKIPVSVVSGVSSIDAVLSATGSILARGDAVLAGDLDYFASAALDETSHLIVFMPDESKKLFSAFIKRCARARSPRTKAAFVECGNGETIADRVAWTTLASAPRLWSKAAPGATLLVLPK